MRLFHIVERQSWQRAVPSGELRPASLAVEGFVHCSFATQVAGSANRHYADAVDLCVLEIDDGRLVAEVRVEDSYRSGVGFPHLYGPVPVPAVVAVHQLMRGVDGNWCFSPGGAAAPASPDR